MWLLNKIDGFRKAHGEKLAYEHYLEKRVSLSLKDGVNHLPRPEKILLRILGNGNSLKSVVDSLSTDCDYMVMNAHILHPSYSELKPRYYVLADPTFFHPNACYDGTEVVKKILAETNWEMTLFVPWEHTRGVKLEPTEWVTIQYVNQSWYFGPEQYREYLYDHNLAMPKVNNVLASSIYLAIFLGYKEVELYGVEHSWTRDLYVNKYNHTCIKDSHFFDEEEVEANVIIDGSGIPMKFHEVLQMYADYFPAYWELRELADKHKCHIVNCAPNSFIDAFEKKDLK